MKIKSTEDQEFFLTKTRIEERETGIPYVRFVKFSDLKKYLPKNGAHVPANYDAEPEEWPKILWLKYKEEKAKARTTWLEVREDGRLSIGCKDFDAKATRAIYKAAGIRRKVSSPAA
jgi:hypothetical protein